MKKILKLMFKAFNLFLYLTIVLILCLMLMYLTKTKINKTILPDVFGFTPVIVVSGSMEPAIKVNDIIIVKKTHYSQLKPGDIVLYFNKLQDITIIHRLIEINGGKAITKGDANFTSDIPFSVTQIYGKYIVTIPYIGQIAKYIKTHVIVYYLYAAILLVYIFLFIVKIKKKKLNHKIDS